MNASEFLKAVMLRPTANFFAVTPDVSGMVELLPRVMRKVAHPDDVVVVSAREMVVARAREISRESGMSPRAGSARTHFVLHHVEDLDPHCVGPLLLAVEESSYARFVFVAHRISPAASTLASRSSRVCLPFLSKRAVLGNLQALKYDARMADSEGHWDGTLGGTLRNLKERLAVKAIDRALGQADIGAGMVDLIGESDSPAFVRCLTPKLSRSAARFLRRGESPERRALCALLATMGKGHA